MATVAYKPNEVHEKGLAYIAAKDAVTAAELALAASPLDSLLQAQLDANLAKWTEMVNQFTANKLVLPQTDVGSFLSDVQMWQKVYQGAFITLRVQGVAFSILKHQPLLTPNSPGSQAWGKLQEAVRQTIIQTTQQASDVKEVNRNIILLYNNFKDTSFAFSEGVSSPNIAQLRIDSLRGSLDTLTQKVKSFNKQQLALANIPNLVGQALIGIPGALEFKKQCDTASNASLELEKNALALSRVYEPERKLNNEIAGMTGLLAGLNLALKFNQQNSSMLKYVKENLDREIDVLKGAPTEQELRDWLVQKREDMQHAKAESDRESRRLKAEALRSQEETERQLNHTRGQMIDHLKTIPPTVIKTKVVKSGIWPFSRKRTVQYEELNVEYEGNKLKVGVLDEQIAFMQKQAVDQQQLNNLYAEAHNKLFANYEEQLKVSFDSEEAQAKYIQGLRDVVEKKQAQLANEIKTLSSQEATYTSQIAVVTSELGAKKKLQVEQHTHLEVEEKNLRAKIETLSAQIQSAKASADIARKALGAGSDDQMLLLLQALQELAQIAQVGTNLSQLQVKMQVVVAQLAAAISILQQGVDLLTPPEVDWSQWLGALDSNFTKYAQNFPTALELQAYNDEDWAITVENEVDRKVIQEAWKKRWAPDVMGVLMHLSQGISIFSENVAILSQFVHVSTPPLQAAQSQE